MGQGFATRFLHYHCRCQLCSGSATTILLRPSFFLYPLPALLNYTIPPPAPAPQQQTHPPSSSSVAGFTTIVSPMQTIPTMIITTTNTAAAQTAAPASLSPPPASQLPPPPSLPQPVVRTCALDYTIVSNAFAVDAGGLSKPHAFAGPRKLIYQTLRDSDKKRSRYCAQQPVVGKADECWNWSPTAEDAETQCWLQAPMKSRALPAYTV